MLLFIKVITMKVKMWSCLQGVNILYCVSAYLLLERHLTQ